MSVQLQLWPLHYFLSTAARMILNHEANDVITLQWFFMSLPLKAQFLPNSSQAPCDQNSQFSVPLWPHLLLPLPYYANPVTVLKYANCVPASGPLHVPFPLTKWCFPKINRAGSFTSFKSVSFRKFFLSHSFKNWKLPTPYLLSLFPAVFP